MTRSGRISSIPALKAEEGMYQSSQNIKCATQQLVEVPQVLPQPPQWARPRVATREHSRTYVIHMQRHLIREVKPACATWQKPIPQRSYRQRRPKRLALLVASLRPHPPPPFTTNMTICMLSPAARSNVRSQEKLS